MPTKLLARRGTRCGTNSGRLAYMAAACNLLYRIYDPHGTLLYIGSTTNPAVRFQEHQHHQPWWDEASEIKLCRYATYAEMLEAEADSIRSENPRYNIAHSKPRPFKRRRPRGTGTVCQRADGYWIGRIDLGKDADGKRRFKTVYGKERSVVEDKLAALKAEEPVA